MRIEFSYWPTNTEVSLIEDIGEWPHVVRSFYTSAKRLGIFGRTVGSWECPFDAKFNFDVMEEVSPLPMIGGSLGHWDPYWDEHPAQKARMLLERAERGEA